MELFISIIAKLTKADANNDIKYLQKKLQELKIQNQQHAPLAQVNVQIKEILNEIQRLKESEEAFQDDLKQKEKLRQQGTPPEGTALHRAKKKP
jgi:hypothetical protein